MRRKKPLTPAQLRKRLLKQKVRRKIYDHIRMNPGIHFYELVEEFELSKTNCFHHLGVLVENRQIKDHKFGIYRRFYPINYRKSIKELSPKEEKILSLLRARGEMTQGEIVKATGICQSTVCRKLLRLIEQGHVRMEPTNYARKYGLMKKTQIEQIPIV